MKGRYSIPIFLIVLLNCFFQEGVAQDTLYVNNPETSVFAPDPVRATMLAVALPGMGQIYNKKYWKVPIVYLGFGGVAYSISYFSSNYNTFMTAYQDFTDDIAATDSYRDLIVADPSTYDRMNYPDTYNSSLESQYKDALLSKLDYFKKYRDFSYIGIGLWYLMTILDAHVDACLFNYDVSDNLGIDIVPLALMQENGIQTGVNLSVRFNF